MTQSEPLSIIFDRFWRTGEVPKDWRKANVTLLSKRARRRAQGDTASPPSIKR